MTDAKAIDAQYGVEKGLTSLAAALAGGNLIYESSGMTASLLGASFEAFVLDNEMHSAIYRMLRGIESELGGIYNLNGPVDGEMTIGGLLDACKKTTGSDAEFEWVETGFLAERGINPWQQMPVWIPPVGEYAGFHKTSVTKAVAAGLTTRPLAMTIRDTIAWFDEWAPDVLERRGWVRQPGVNAPGVSSEQESSVLEEWDAREG